MRRVSAGGGSSEGRGDNYIFTDMEELDITDFPAVRECVVSNNIDIVVNCAAYTNVDGAEDDYTTAELINYKAVKNLASVCAENGAVLIHISTDYVFNGEKNLPYKEDEPVSPLGCYGRTKLMGEMAVTGSRCRYLIFRTSWLYSEHGNNFVKTIMRLTGERDNLNVVFDQAGTPTYAGDLAEAIFDIIDNRKYTGKQGIYHFSNEGVCSWYDFAVEIAGISGHGNCRILPCHSDEFPCKARRPVFSVLDKTKFKRDFRITIPHWRVSLMKCMRGMSPQISRSQ